jgi:dTDP-4-dehydrorhamnose reductase
LRVFVTGSSGLLGQQLISVLEHGGHEIFAGYHTRSPRLGKPVQLDLASPDEIDAIFKKLKLDVVMHTAAVTDVDFCEEKPDLARIVNGEATGRIGAAARKAGVYVIYVSTDYVFDGLKGQYNEQDSPCPVNQYGQSKLLGEELLRESGAEYAVARTSVVYGWGREHKPNFAIWVLSRLRSNHLTDAVVDQTASPTYNNNLAEMLLALAEKRFQGIFHLAGSTRINRYDFAIRIARTFNLDTSLVRAVSAKTLAWKARRPVDSSLDVNKASRLLRFKPLILDEALERFRLAKPP